MVSAKSERDEDEEDEEDDNEEDDGREDEDEEDADDEDEYDDEPEREPLLPLPLPLPLLLPLLPLPLLLPPPSDDTRSLRSASKCAAAALRFSAMRCSACSSRCFLLRLR